MVADGDLSPRGCVLKADGLALALQCGSAEARQPLMSYTQAGKRTR